MKPLKNKLMSWKAFHQVGFCRKIDEVSIQCCHIRKWQCKPKCPAGIQIHQFKPKPVYPGGPVANLPDASVLGIIVSDSFRTNSIANSWVFAVTYDGMGYIKDDDADDINMTTY